MTIHRAVFAWALVTATAWPTAALAQREATAKTSKPQVEIVHTLGCAEQRDHGATGWWLVRAVDPEVSRAGVFNVEQVEKANETALGTGEYELIGVADFLDADSLLESGERAQFTTPEQVNATGELRAGRRVLVKGLLIEAEPAKRINLLAVVGLADRCE